MAFDGVFTYKTAAELNEARLSHIDKIYQPSRDELVFLLRKKGFAGRLLISAKSGAARVQFTEQKYENPAVPPMFCMLVRKHFSSAKFLGAEILGLERLIELKFEATNEMGDLVNIAIVCELIGNQSNIILVDQEGRIIDAVRRSDIETARRIIQPGAIYEYPEPQGKLNILTTDADEITLKILNLRELPLSRALLDTLDGLSPLICRELAFRICGGDEPVLNIDATVLSRELGRFKTELLGSCKPSLLLKPDGTPTDFSYMPIMQYEGAYTIKEYPTLASLLDAYYSEREHSERIRRGAADIIKLVDNLIARARKRLMIRQEELRACGDREKLRIYGELIKANLHLIENGSRRAVVQNFYDENLGLIEIPLDPALSPSANATKYFKEYKKSHTAEQTLSVLIEKDTLEIEYLESVADSITRCKTVADIAEIRQELSDAGYIRCVNTKRKKETVSAPKEIQSAEGYRILIGKNNTQNDYITTRLASKGDLWFHVKGAAGSHVVVMCSGKEVSDDTVMLAARLAAENSKAASSANVPVDYTPIKFVKKPNGAKPGMVIYTTNKTVFVTPEEVKR